MPFFPRSSLMVASKSKVTFSAAHSLFFQQSLQRSRAFFSSDHSAATASHLPLINTLTDWGLELKKSQALPFEKTTIICIQHTFPTMVPLLRSFICLGVPADKILAMGKSYSECPDAIKEIKDLGIYYQKSSSQIGLGGFARGFNRDICTLFSKCAERITAGDNLLILDHGGNALATIPPELMKMHKVVGVEKTTAGIVNPEIQGLPFPIIYLGDCRAKKELESPIIAEEIIKKLISEIPVQAEKLLCGVVGYGSIGRALTEKLLSLGHKVMVYDHDQSKLNNVGKAMRTQELVALVGFSDYIFGCTGKDITTSLDAFKFCNKNKTLISCSSEDREYLSLLQLIQQKYSGKVLKEPLSDVEYTNDVDCLIRILSGGFPRNFDRVTEGALPEDIQFTRALALGGVLQAALFFNKPHLSNMVGGYMLDPELQMHIVSRWLRDQSVQRFSPEVIAHFKDKNWIADKSGGLYEPCDIFTAGPTVGEMAERHSSSCFR